MGRKGISPLIAAVLLIAFTMAVASIFAQWAPSLIQEAQADTRDKTSEVENCSGIVLEIQSANTTHMTVQQTGGSNPAGDFMATWYYDSADPIQNSSSLTGTTTNITVVNNKNVSGSQYHALSEAEAVPQDCEGAPAATYTP